MQVQNNRGKAKSQENYIGKFDQKKLRSYLLVDSFRRLHMEQRANRVLSCGHYLQFAEHVETGDRRLIAADFCRDRLCPMCSWRRSLRVFSDLSKVFAYIYSEEGSDFVPVFMTLTVKNCSPDQLSSTLDLMFKSWNRFGLIYAVKRAFVGWFRCLEVTYNKKDDTFHPHFHVMMLARKDYFSSPDYLSIHKIVKYWRQALNVDYDPICHIRRVRGTYTNPDDVRKAVLETAKYTVKDSDYLYEHNDKLTDKVVEALAVGLNNRRLIAYGGYLLKVSRLLKIKEDSIDLTDDRTTIEHLLSHDDVMYVVVTYRWTVGFGKFRKEV